MCGFAWSIRENVAEMFARGLNASHGDGVVLLTTDAPAEAIIAEPNDHSIYLQEYEYTVDNSKLTEIRVMKSYPRTNN